jgi:hypothetical protein
MMGSNLRIMDDAFECLLPSFLIEPKSPVR